MIIITLKDAVIIFSYLFIAPRTVSNTQTGVASVQWANHAQHDLATWYKKAVQLLILTEMNLHLALLYSFTENVNRQNKGKSPSTGRKLPVSSLRILKPEDLGPERYSNASCCICDWRRTGEVKVKSLNTFPTAVGKFTIQIGLIISFWLI